MILEGFGDVFTWKSFAKSTSEIVISNHTPGIKWIYMWRQLALSHNRGSVRGRIQLQLLRGDLRKDCGVCKILVSLTAYLREIWKLFLCPDWKNTLINEKVRITQP